MLVSWLLLCYTATIPVGFFLYFFLGGAIGKHFVSHFVFADTRFFVSYANCSFSSRFYWISGS
ncbi:hypothetical protein Hanom_Chr05g00419201 [Helianthus anomalus]